MEEARDLVRLAELWGRWSGISINLKKSRCIAINFATGESVDTSIVLCAGKPLKTLLPTEPFKYLGVLLDRKSVV